MKLKFALVTGFAVVLTGCASNWKGTILTGTVERIYTANEVKRDRPEKYQRYLDLGIAKESDMNGTSEIAVKLFRGMFVGSGLLEYAYVPPNLRAQVERGDFVQIRRVEDGWPVKNNVDILDRVIQKQGKEGPCKWVGGVVADDMVYCNGKKVTAIRPENQDNSSVIILPKD